MINCLEDNHSQGALLSRKKKKKRKPFIFSWISFKTVRIFSSCVRPNWEFVCLAIRVSLEKTLFLSLLAADGNQEQIIMHQFLTQIKEYWVFILKMFLLEAWV